jgi:hypothetical protein
MVEVSSYVEVIEPIVETLLDVVVEQVGQLVAKLHGCPTSYWIVASCLTPINHCWVLACGLQSTKSLGHMTLL